MSDFIARFDGGHKLRVDLRGTTTIYLVSFRALLDLLTRLVKEREMPQSLDGLMNAQVQQVIREQGLPLALNSWGAWVDEQLFLGKLKGTNLTGPPLAEDQVVLVETDSYFFARTQTEEPGPQVYFALKPGVLQSWVDQDVLNTDDPYALLFLLSARYVNLLQQVTRAHRKP